MDRSKHGPALVGMAAALALLLTVAMHPAHALEFAAARVTVTALPLSSEDVDISPPPELDAFAGTSLAGAFGRAFAQPGAIGMFGVSSGPFLDMSALMRDTMFIVDLTPDDPTCPRFSLGEPCFGLNDSGARLHVSLSGSATGSAGADGSVSWFRGSTPMGGLPFLLTGSDLTIRPTSAGGSRTFILPPGIIDVAVGLVGAVSGVGVLDAEETMRFFVDVPPGVGFTSLAGGFPIASTPPPPDATVPEPPTWLLLGIALPLLTATRIWTRRTWG